MNRSGKAEESVPTASAAIGGNGVGIGGGGIGGLLLGTAVRGV